MTLPQKTKLRCTLICRNRLSKLSKKILESAFAISDCKWEQFDLSFGEFCPMPLPIRLYQCAVSFVKRFRLVGKVLRLDNLSSKFESVYLITDETKFTRNGLANVHNDHLWAYEKPACDHHKSISKTFFYKCVGKRRGKKICRAIYFQ